MAQQKLGMEVGGKVGRTKFEKGGRGNIGGNKNPLPTMFA